MSTVSEALTHEFLSKLEILNLSLKNPVNSGYSGIRTAKSKGNSQEFSDYRNYTPGDDLRRIDWNSYGRLNRLFLKLYSEEKQATFNIFLDKSKSMDFGDKFLHAKLIAASLAFIALKNSDRVNIFAFDNKIDRLKTGVSSKGLFPQTVKFLDSLEPAEQSRLTPSMIADKNLGSGVSFIISDFFTDDFKDCLKLLQNRRQSVYLIHILSPEETEPTYSQKIRLLDSENRDFLDLDLTPGILEAYKKELDNFKNNISEFCKKRNIAYIFAPTQNHVLKTVTEIINYHA